MVAMTNPEVSEQVVHELVVSGGDVNQTGAMVL